MLIKNRKFVLEGKDIAILRNHIFNIIFGDNREAATLPDEAMEEYITDDIVDDVESGFCDFIIDSIDKMAKDRVLTEEEFLKIKGFTSHNKITNIEKLNEVEIFFLNKALRDYQLFISTDAVLRNPKEHLIKFLKKRLTHDILRFAFIALSCFITTTLRFEYISYGLFALAVISGFFLVTSYKSLMDARNSENVTAELK